ncbi:MAG: hypothetical protein ACK4IK_10755 [Bacteroidia bacterium]
MYSKSKLLSVLSIIILCFFISSCGIFRKKNRCSDCPKWSKKEYHFNGIDEHIKHA